MPIHSHRLSLGTEDAQLHSGGMEESLPPAPEFDISQFSHRVVPTDPVVTQHNIYIFMYFYVYIYTTAATTHPQNPS